MHLRTPGWNQTQVAVVRTQPEFMGFSRYLMSEGTCWTDTSHCFARGHRQDSHFGKFLEKANEFGPLPLVSVQESTHVLVKA